MNGGVDAILDAQGIEPTDDAPVQRYYDAAGRQRVAVTPSGAGASLEFIDADGARVDAFGRPVDRGAPNAVLDLPFPSAEVNRALGASGARPLHGPHGVVRYEDANGIPRLTIRDGSPPVVELRNELGQRLDSNGAPIEPPQPLPVSIAGTLPNDIDKFDDAHDIGFHPAHYGYPCPTCALPNEATYTKSDEPIFGPSGEPQPEDVHQGQDGDCWFLSALMSLAAMRPDIIRDMIHVEEDGTYTVTFHNPSQTIRAPDGSILETPGDADLVVNVQPTFGDPRGAWTDRPLWPAILEKAYAQAYGGSKGYPGIEIGLDGSAFQTVAGYEPQSIPLPGASPLAARAVQAGSAALHRDDVYEPLFTSLSQAHDAGVPMTALAATPGGPGGDDIDSLHVYSVQSFYRADDGTPMVQLFNPHNLAGERRSDGGVYGDREGRFDMPFADFATQYAEVNMGKPPAYKP